MYRVKNTFFPARLVASAYEMDQCIHISKDMKWNSQNKNNGVLSSRENKDLSMSAKEQYCLVLTLPGTDNVELSHKQTLYEL